MALGAVPEEVPAGTSQKTSLRPPDRRRQRGPPQLNWPTVQLDSEKKRSTPLRPPCMSYRPVYPPFTLWRRNRSAFVHFESCCFFSNLPAGWANSRICRSRDMAEEGSRRRNGAAHLRRVINPMALRPGLHKTLSPNNKHWSASIDGRGRLWIGVDRTACTRCWHSVWPSAK